MDINKKTLPCMTEYEQKEGGETSALLKEKPDEQAVPLKSWRILLVEDHPIIQKVHTCMLKKIACTVDIAENANSTLALHNRYQYDLIFMDIGLPSISGLSLIKLIRKKEAGKKRTPIVVLTGYISQKTRDDCIIQGADGIAIKPIEPEKIRSLVKQVCTGQKLEG